MKILKAMLVGILILILIALIGIYIFLKTFNIEQYKPQIISQASTILGRPVNLGDISLNVSLKDGIRLNLKNISIGDDPAFQTGNFFQTENVYLNLDLLGLLTTHAISFSNLQVKAPRITIIKDQNGLMNVETIGKKPLAATGQPPIQSPSPSLKAPQAVSTRGPVMPPIAVQKITIENAAVSYVDLTTKLPLKLAVTHLDLTVDKFSLSGPFHFYVSAAVFNANPNMSLQGNGQLDLQHNALKLENVAVTTDLSQISLADLKTGLAPVLGSMLFPESLKGKLCFTIKDLTAGLQGLENFSADLNLTQAAVDIKEIMPGVPLNISQVNLKADNFSLNAPFNVTFQGAYASDTPDVFLQASSQIDLPEQKAQLKNSTLTVDLGAISFPYLQSSIAALKDVTFPESMKGKIQLTIADLEAGAKGLGPIAGQAILTDGSLKLKQLGVPLSQIKAKIVADATTVNLEDFSLNIGKGKMSGVGKLTDYLHAQAYSGQLNIEDIDMAQVLAGQKQPVQMEGSLSGKATFEGSGLTPEAIKSSLTAQSHFAIANGKLKDINILQVVVSKLEEIPNIDGKLQTGLPASYQQKLEEKDTIFQKLELIANIQNGQILIQPVDMEAEGFIFKGQGNIDFDQRLNLNGSFEMASDLSQAMEQAVPELQYLYNAQQQIEFPMVVTGTVGKPRPLPDFKYITKRAVINEGKRQIEKLISKYIPVQSADGQGTDQSGQQQNANAAGQVIGNLLNNILK